MALKTRIERRRARSIVILFLLLPFYVYAEFLQPNSDHTVAIVIWNKTLQPEKYCLPYWYPDNTLIKGCQKTIFVKQDSIQTYINKYTLHLTDIPVCYIHSPQIQYVDDENTMTLGHEVGVHCFNNHRHPNKQKMKN